jgi:hypothetical protein
MRTKRATTIHVLTEADLRDILRESISLMNEESYGDGVFLGAGPYDDAAQAMVIAMEEHLEAHLTDIVGSFLGRYGEDEIFPRKDELSDVADDLSEKIQRELDVRLLAKRAIVTAFQGRRKGVR